MTNPVDRLGSQGVLVRFIFALVLVYATWNPWGKSFVHWVVMPFFNGGTDSGTSAPLKFLLAVALVAGWAVYIQATRRSLGAAGTVLVAAVCAGIVWLLSSWKLFTMSGDVISHLVLICTAILLAVGMSWSHLSRRMSGQTDTDVIE
ncbi:MAG TPA: DUF6524 family protein [Gemmatimonadales bacterium]|nr:DUF6524 family protein [Gemmatimonadales bacterium]